ncbi:MAG TPA: DMT family transporter [Mycobacteriales bacterium]|jgi:drug/metabolite transporter (DMT)-like permease|nr:DMT family transporter [Mycobacteriales bacterium]
MASTASVAVAVPCALGAAVAFAVANVEQMRAARVTEAPAEVSATLLVRLARSRKWLIGLATAVGGFGLQAVALFLAPVVLVQPLIVTELLFALPLAAWYANARLHSREWVGAALVAGGITAFLVVGNPSGNNAHITTFATVAMTVVVGAGVILLVLVAESFASRPMLRASGLALAASACFGMLSVMTKVVGRQFQHDKLDTLAHPQCYVLAVFAISGLLLSQTAFRIAPLSVSLPVIDIGEPAVASLLAVLALHETLDLSSGSAVGVALSASAATIGVALLDSSPNVHAMQEEVTAIVLEHTENAEKPAGSQIPETT